MHRKQNSWSHGMLTQSNNHRPVQSSSGWLKNHYFARFAFSTAWAVAALLVARDVPMFAAVMLVAYPAWDALANLVDARRNGGLAANKTQLLNLVVSAITTVAVAIALGHGMNSVLVVFGIWAALAGFLQLATGARRWKSYGAQWAMVLSGAQSALAGTHFISKAGGDAPVGIADIAPYAAFGAFYFLVSAVWLAVSEARKNAVRDACVETR
ncbi:hypothetical protein [Luteimonas lutimaris]|nr:hypothetical protein [Luteimonas sp.]